MNRSLETSTRYPTSVLRMYEMNRTSQLLSRLEDLVARCPEHRFEVDLLHKESDDGPGLAGSRAWRKWLGCARWFAQLTPRP